MSTPRLRRTAVAALLGGILFAVAPWLLRSVVPELFPQPAPTRPGCGFGHFDYTPIRQATVQLGALVGSISMVRAFLAMSSRATSTVDASVAVLLCAAGGRLAIATSMVQDTPAACAMALSTASATVIAASSRHGSGDAAALRNIATWLVLAIGATAADTLLVRFHGRHPSWEMQMLLPAASIAMAALWIAAAAAFPDDLSPSAENIEGPPSI